MTSLKSALEDSHLTAFFCGPLLIGHHVTTTQTVLYARQKIALGKGQFGQIYLENAQNECEGFPSIRAVKEINKAYSSDHGIDWEREIQALAILSSCNDSELFVSFYGWYENAETIFMAMEYFPLGDLSNYVKDVVEEDEIIMIVRQLVSALDVSHKHNIVHRDLNPRNIFVAARAPAWQVKIADFGSSKHVHERTGLWTKTGTSGYMAPEYCNFMRHDPDYRDATAAVDLWSVGCIIYELFTKERFFHEEDKAFKQYCKEPHLPDSFKRSFAGQDAQQAIQRFLDPRAEDRITAEGALSLVWLDYGQPPVLPQLVIEKEFEELTLHQPVGQRPIPTSSPTLTLHPMASNISLASSSVTLVNGMEEAMEPLTNIQSCPSTFSPPPLPPRLPPRRATGTPLRSPSTADSLRSFCSSPAASVRTTYSQNSGSFASPMTNRGRMVSAPAYQGPYLRVDDGHERGTSSRNSSFSDIAAPPQSNQGTNPELPSRRPTLPPRRKTSETSQQSSAHVMDSTHDTSESLELALVDTEQIEDDQTVDKWFVVFFEYEQWYMNFGPIASAEDQAASCDLCEYMYRMTGNRRVMRNNFLHLCVSCGKNRILCERCARDAINVNTDPHQADHTLRRVGSAYSFAFSDLLSSNKFPAQPIVRGKWPTEFGHEWLASDHGFRAPESPPSKHFQVRFVLDIPPGSFQVATYLRIAFDRTKIATEAMGGARKKWMKTTKDAFGHIAVGAQLIPADIDPSNMPPEKYMPDNHVETSILYSADRSEYTLTLQLKKPVQAGAGERLAIIIRSTHDRFIFKSGCPFVWYLNYVGLSQFGEKVQLATKGELTRREQVLEEQKERQKRAEKDRRIDLTMKTLGAANSTATLTGAVLGAAANMQKRRHHKMAHMNNYIGAYNGLYAHSEANESVVGGDYSHQQPGHHQRQNTNMADTMIMNDMTHEWVSTQAVEPEPAAPFVGTFEAVEYTVGDNGAAATYTYWGGSVR